MALAILPRHGSSLILLTDNTTSEACVNNKKSRDKPYNAEWLKIQKILISNHVNLVAKRVTLKDNKADELSRGIRSGQSVRDQIVLDLPRDLCPWLVQSVFVI
jgi:hypothetical protein